MGEVPPPAVEAEKETEDKEEKKEEFQEATLQTTGVKQNSEAWSTLKIELTYIFVIWMF